MRKKIELTKGDYLKIRISIILLSIIIGASCMFAYEEISELRSDYREAMQIWDDYKSVGAVVSAAVHDTPQVEEEVLLPSPEMELGEFSAYNSDVNQCAGDPTIMANGEKVFEGAMACPVRFDFGTQIEVEGMGVYTCADRMAKRYRETNHFDLFFWDYQDAIQLGRKQLKWREV